MLGEQAEDGQVVKLATSARMFRAPCSLGAPSGDMASLSSSDLGVMGSLGTTLRGSSLPGASRKVMSKSLIDLGL